MAESCGGRAESRISTAPRARRTESSRASPGSGRRPVSSQLWRASRARLAWAVSAPVGHRSRPHQQTLPDRAAASPLVPGGDRPRPGRGARWSRIFRTTAGSLKKAMIRMLRDRCQPLFRRGHSSRAKSSRLLRCPLDSTHPWVFVEHPQECTDVAHDVGFEGVVGAAHQEPATRRGPTPSWPCRMNAPTRGAFQSLAAIL